VTVTASFGNFSSTATATETVTVSANPDMSIDNFACNTSGLSSTLTATDLNNSGATLSWTRNGAAFAGNVASIEVTLPGVYVVTATTTGGRILHRARLGSVQHVHLDVSRVTHAEV